MKGGGVKRRQEAKECVAGKEVSVAWPDPGPELRRRERSPSLHVPCIRLWNGAGLAPVDPLPTCVYLSLVSGNAG